MSQINWGLATGPTSFDNALTRGFQMGSAIADRREQKEYRDQQMQMRQQELDARLAERQAAAALKQREQQRADLPMLGRLLDYGSQGEQQWQQALQVARQYGIDTSNVPQVFDAEWAKSQARTIKALQTPEGQEVMSTAGKQAYDEGFRPGDGKFEGRVKEIWRQSGAIPYTHSDGTTRLYIPGRGEPATQPITEGTVIENDAGEKLVLRGGKWQPMTEGGAGASRIGPDFLEGLQPNP